MTQLAITHIKKNQCLHLEIRNVLAISAKSIPLILEKKMNKKAPRRSILDRPGIEEYFSGLRAVAYCLSKYKMDSLRLQIPHENFKSFELKSFKLTLFSRIFLRSATINMWFGKHLTEIGQKFAQ
jgi:hypothetical protein